MQFNWKYTLPLALASLVSLSSVAQADSDSAQLRNLENRLSALEQRKGASGMINPQGRPQVRDGADLFVFGELLYWHSHENGLNVAVKQHNAKDDATQTLSQATTKHIRGKWNWGFRTGLGYNTLHDGWDVKLAWLRFTDHGTKNGSNRNGGAIYSSLGTPANPTGEALKPAAGFASYWGYNLNQLDLELGREFFVSKWMTLRPHMGLRTNWLNQSLQGTFYAVDKEGKNNSFEKKTDQWWGMGLSFGMNTQWGLGAGWSLFGDAAAAIVYGFHKPHVVALTQNVETGEKVPFVGLKDGFRIAHPVFDLGAGLRWDQMFCKDYFHIRLQLGWETHVYVNQNQFPVFTSKDSRGVFVGNQGDLTTQGWTFSTRFDF